ncbi:MAG: hypothetical protein ACR2KF_06990 [Nitrososphaeraceae archaeon]
MNSKLVKKRVKSLITMVRGMMSRASSISLFLNKTEITRNILENKFEKLIAEKIQANGSQPFEMHRAISHWTIIYLISWAFSIWRRLVKILVSICGTIGHQRVPDYKRDSIICCHML